MLRFREWGTARNQKKCPKKNKGRGNGSENKLNARFKDCGAERDEREADKTTERKKSPSKKKEDQRTSPVAVAHLTQEPAGGSMVNGPKELKAGNRLKRQNGSKKEKHTIKGTESKVQVYKIQLGNLMRGGTDRQSKGSHRNATETLSDKKKEEKNPRG